MQTLSQLSAVSIFLVFTGMSFAQSAPAQEHAPTAESKVKKLYKVIDKDGKIHYSDHPVPGAQELATPDIPSISIRTPKIEIKSLEDELEERRDPNAAYYQVFEIAGLENDGVIRNNGGTASFNITMAPALAKAHFLEFYLDGKLIKQKQKGLSITAENVTYGPHTINVSVVSTKGKVVQTTGPIKFNLLHVVRKSSKANQTRNQKILRNNALKVEQFKFDLPEHPKVPTYDAMQNSSTESDK